MKRTITYGLLFIMLVGLVIIACGDCPTPPENAFVTDMLAGQTIDVGNITIWNNATHLFVLYEVTEDGWYLTETHLDVQCEVGDIPQTPMDKKGGPNPVPGQFTYSESFEPAEYQTSWCQVIEKPDCIACGGDLAIAAHAVVVHITKGCIDVVSDTTLGETPIVAPWDSMGLLYLGVPFTFPAEAKWIWKTAQVTDPVNGEIVEFSKTFTIPGIYILEKSGNIYVTCDNGYELKVNNVYIGKAQLAENFRTAPSLTNDIVWWYDSVTPPYSCGGGPYGWQTVEKWDISGPLAIGTNTLQLTGVNEADTATECPGGEGTCNSNPAGCKFSVDGGICYTVVDKEETAWGEGPRFNTKGSWGMYVPYHWPCIIRFPEEGNAYIGYEDRPARDFDYNDFGMNMEVEEIYIDGCLDSIDMTFTSVVKLAGDTHEIHIKRSFDSATSYDYKITRSVANVGTETPAGTGSGSGDFDIILFDSAYFAAGKVVTVNIDITSGCEAYIENPTPPRWDLEELFAYYDPWMYDRGISSAHHIEKTQSFGGITVPYILVVPYTDWPAPGEGVTITGPYPYFDDYYSTQDPIYETWYIPGP